MNVAWRQRHGLVASDAHRFPPLRDQFEFEVALQPLFGHAVRAVDDQDDGEDRAAPADQQRRLERLAITMNDRGQVSPNTENQGLLRSQWLLGSRSTALLANPPPEPSTSRSSIRMFRKPSPIEYTAQHMSQRRLGKSLCRFAQIGEVCPNLKTCPYNHDRRWFRYEPTRGMWDFCLLYTSPSPRDATLSRMPSSA